MKYYRDKNAYDFSEAGMKSKSFERKKSHKRLRRQDVKVVGQNAKEISGTRSLEEL